MFAMIRKRIFGSLFGLMLMLAACQPDVQQLAVHHRSVSEKTNNWEIEFHYPVFSSSDSSVNQSLAILNQQVETFIADLQDSLKSEALKLSESFETDTLPHPAWVCALDARDSLFMATNQYVSLRFTVYTFTGGAHGMTHFYAFNYNVEDRQLLSPAEIVDQEKADSVNRLLSGNFENREQCFNIEPTLGLTGAINFTPETVSFTFEHYVLGPYACGSAVVDIPRVDLDHIFRPEIAGSGN